jgi:polyhydroxybutyrate depolymerase
MSNGGEMCYLMAYLRPDVFAAFAPIAGLSMEWSYRKYEAERPVPMMEVHGTEDKTSRWEGDPFNEGGWGSYLAVPQAVGYWAAKARCTHEETVELPLVRNKVILHRYMGGEPAWKGGPATEVRLYEVIGGKHTWALNDMDTCNEIWNFFSIYLR